MKPKILVSAPYAMGMIDDYRKRLESAGCSMIVADVNERLTEEELLPLVGDIDGIICGDDRITLKVLEAAPRLKVISKWGTGIDSIDQKNAKARGVQVLNTPGAFTDPVADTVLGYILLFARKLDAMSADIRAGNWKKPQLHSLSEMTLGIIGIGNCGKAVTRRARSFGMRVLGNDIIDIPKDFLAETGLEVKSLDDLLKEADIVSLNCTLGDSSFHIINTKSITLMKQDSYLINTARGPLIEESALVEALETKRISGAALDVFENEPLPADSPLRRFDNCYFAPHNANSSPRAASRVHENTINNLLKALGLKNA